MKKVMVMAVMAAVLVLLSACAENSAAGRETGNSQNIQETKAPETKHEETKAPETKPAATVPETEKLSAEELRQAILSAAKASGAADAFGRIKDAFAAAGADMSMVSSGAELIKSELFKALPSVATEANDDLTEMLEWMTKDWDGGYHKLTEDLLTEEQRKALLDSYNDYSNTEKIIMYYNTPQQLLRAYAEAMPGDVLVSVTPTKTATRDKLLAVIEKVKTVYLKDGETVDPRESVLTLINEKGMEQEMSFQTAFVQNMAVPYRLTALGETVQEPHTIEAQKTDLPKDPLFKAGFGRADITSDIKIPLAGYGSTASRMSNQTIIPEDRLTATAIAFSDGTNTEILFTMDTIRVPTAWSELAAAAIEEATGIGMEHISFSSTHTHSGPDIGNEESRDQPAKAITSSQPYFQVWKAALVEAAADALSDLKTVSETKVAVVKVEHMNWTRHWRADDGQMEGSNFSSGKNMGATEIADPDMQIIRFVRDGEKDVVLVNWQAHAKVASASSTKYGSEHRPFISADFPGYMRRYVERMDNDCLVAFFQGAAGNVSCRAMEADEKKYNIDEVDEYGEKLGRYVLKAMENMTAVQTGAVQGMQEEHVAFDDGYEGTVRNIRQNVITIGDSIAFVTAGYEMFNVNGEAAKARSPFAVTFVCTCGQGHEYMPSFQAHHYHIFGKGQETAYEVKGTQCNVVPGTAEDLVDGLVYMLDRLWENLGLGEKDITKPFADKVQQFKEDDVKKPEPKNLAPDCTVTYTYKLITKEKYSPELINDGERGDNSLTTTAGWYFAEDGEIVFDLGAVKKLSGYVIYNYQNPVVYGGLKAWTVYISEDGENWEAQSTVQGNEGGIVNADFQGTPQARFVKLVALDAWENTKLNDSVKERRVIRIGEFVIYGD